ncbi:hypothetical protein ABRP92_00125, partial [Pectobacterium aroidearum]|uniref:hypothetical protein n=1 Tax=Pectobacterium aroidearum TaxID=1201031 RepID=UPI0032EB48A5
QAFGGNYAADAVPSSISGFTDRLRHGYSPHKWDSPFGPAQVLFKNVSDVFVRRGASFRRVHAAHPKPAISSA